MSTIRSLGAPLFFVTVAALLLRGLYLWIYSRNLPFLGQPVLDAALYDELARNALTEPIAKGPHYHAPGYVQFLSLIYRVFGPSPLKAVLVQAALGTLTTVLTMLTAWRLFGRREAVFSGILVLCTGSLYFFESKLLVETWALFLTVGAVYFAVLSEAGTETPMDAAAAKSFESRLQDGFRPPPPPRIALVGAVLSGALAGLLAVTRANMILLAACLIVVFLVRSFRRRRPWRTSLLFGAGFIFALLPTTAQNIAGGALTPVATNGGLNFFAANYRGAAGVYEDPPGFSGVIARQEAEADSLVRFDLGHELPPAQESSYWFARGLSEIGADPLGWLRLEGRKLWLLVNRQEEEVNGSFGLEVARVPYLRIAAVPFNFLAFAGILGLALALGVGTGRRAARHSLAAPVSVLLAVLATALLFFVMSRLRLAAVPMLAMFTAHALVRADEAWQSGKRRPVMMGVVAVLALVAATWFSPRGSIRNPDWEAQLFVETGRGLDSRGLTSDAVATYEEALKLDAGNVDALLLLGQIALRDYDLIDAIRRFEQAREAAPDNFVIRNNLGILYYQANRWESCDAEMIEAIRLDPTQAGPFFYRGQVSRQNKEYPQAEAFLKQALDRDPGFVGAYVRLIETCLDLDRIDDARRWADIAGQRAVALPPKLAERLR